MDARGALKIDYLYLDDSTCARCGDTGRNIEQALQILGPAAEAMGIHLMLDRHHISSREEALKHHLEVSPTIRINGRDIQANWTESSCEDCSSLAPCDSDINCRDWTWEKSVYHSAPVALLVHEIGSALFTNPANKIVEPLTDLNSNLEKFFSEKQKSCCPPATSSCCDTGCC